MVFGFGYGFGNGRLLGGLTAACAPMVWLVAERHSSEREACALMSDFEPQNAKNKSRKTEANLDTARRFHIWGRIASCAPICNRRPPKAVLFSHYWRPIANRPPGCNPAPLKRSP
jgi:hypothetical protein